LNERLKDAEEVIKNLKSRKDRQCIGRKKNKGQTMHWPKEKYRTDNALAKRKIKDRQRIDQKKNKGQTMHWPKEKYRTDNDLQIL